MRSHSVLCIISVGVQGLLDKRNDARFLVDIPRGSGRVVEEASDKASYRRLDLWGTDNRGVQVFVSLVDCSR